MSLINSRDAEEKEGGRKDEGKEKGGDSIRILHTFF